MSLIFHLVVNWLIGWGGVSVLVAVCAGLVWWFVPIPSIRNLALNIAVGALAAAFFYTAGFNNGVSTTKSEWAAAEQRAIERGSDARQKAEQEIEPLVDTPVADEQPQPECRPAPGSVTPVSRPRAAVPRWMSNDRHNRDNR